MKKQRKNAVSRQLTFDLKGQYLTTKYEDGSISSEPITSEEASLWEAEHGF